MTSYKDIPDAPWIRHTEKYGPPEDPTITCPICGAEQPDEYIIDNWGDIIGCDCCTHTEKAVAYHIDRAMLIRDSMR